MPQFELDKGNADGAAWFESLDAFAQGYVEAMFFTIDEELNEKTVADLSATTRLEIERDCSGFQAMHPALLSKACRAEDYSPKQAGRDFWFTRNHHGVGYWDRTAIAHLRMSPTSSDKVGIKLTHAAHSCGELDLYEGDDGLLYLA